MSVTTGAADGCGGVCRCTGLGFGRTFGFAFGSPQAHGRSFNGSLERDSIGGLPLSTAVGGDSDGGSLLDTIGS